MGKQITIYKFLFTIFNSNMVLTCACGVNIYRFLDRLVLLSLLSNRLLVYLSAENKQASLPGSTILLAYVRRYSVPKWSVRWAGGWVGVSVCVGGDQCGNRAHNTCT